MGGPSWFQATYLGILNCHTLLVSRNTHINTLFLILCSVDLTMEPFLGSTARDTRSFPSPVSSAFSSLSYRQTKKTGH